MKRRLASIAFSLLALVFGEAPSVFAMSPDPSGLWYDPNESGWGITLEQQRSTVFAVLFVYDSSSRPAWYVASIVEPIDIDPPAPPGGPFVGTLYRTSGPYFGAAFDPHAVTPTPVGTLSIAYPDASGETLGIDYTIDGVRVTKSVQRQTWGDNFTDFQGVFQGAAVLDVQPGPGCPVLAVSPPLGIVTAFNVQPNFTTHATHMSWGIGIDTACAVDGAYKQQGQFASIAGTVGCGPVGSPPLFSASASVTGIAFNADGFNAFFKFQQGSCTYAGHLGGVLIR